MTKKTGTKKAGGAPSSYFNRGQRKKKTHPTSSPGDRKNASMTVPGVAAGWPRAGWGPGSLTVSRPPQTSGPTGTTVSAAAVAAALHAATGGCTGLRAGRGEGGASSTACSRHQGSGRYYDIATTGAIEVGKAEKNRGVVVDSPPPPSHVAMSASEGEEEGVGGGEGVVGEMGAVTENGRIERGPENSAEDLARQTDPSKVPNKGAPIGEGGNGSSVKREPPLPEDESLSQKEECGKTGKQRIQKKTSTAVVERGWGELDDISRQSHDDLSLSGGMLLRDLDGSTLEPPSPEPPSPEQQGSPGGTDTCGDGNEQQHHQETGGGVERTMTSQYVR